MKARQNELKAKHQHVSYYLILRGQFRILGYDFEVRGTSGYKYLFRLCETYIGVYIELVSGKLESLV